MNLRWLERDGKMVLQQQIEVKSYGSHSGEKHLGFQWEDVPTVREPKKCNHWQLRKAENSHYGWYCMDCDAALIIHDIKLFEP